MKHRAIGLPLILFLLWVIACDLSALVPAVAPAPDNIATRVEEAKVVAATLTADASTTKQIQTLTPVRLTATPTLSTAVGQVEGKLPEGRGVKITLCDNITLGFPQLQVPIDCNGEFERSTTIDSSGYFLIPEVPPGRYYILFDIPATLEGTLPPGSLFLANPSHNAGANSWSSGEYRCIRLALREVCLQDFDATTNKFFQPPIKVEAGKTTYYSKMR